MAQYLAVFNDPGLTDNSITNPDTVEVVWNLKHACRSLAERRSDGLFGVNVRRLNNKQTREIFPSTTPAATLTLWAVPEGVTSFIEAHAAIMGDGEPIVPDYTVRLGRVSGARAHRVEVAS